MARLRKRPLGTPTTEAITGAEVDGMFRAVLPEGPWPDEDSCLLIAKFLTGNLHFWGGTEAERDHRRRVVAAVKLLHAEIAASYSPPDEVGVRWINPDRLALEKALRRNFPDLRDTPTWKPWMPTAFPVVEVCGGTLEELGHPGGHARDSTAVKLAVLMLRRMGHAGVTAAAVATCLARRPAKPLAK